MANYPTSVPSFSNKSAGQTIAASHVNDLQDEVVAIGSGLLQGTAPLASSNSTVARLSVLGNSTLAGGLTMSGSTGVSMSSGNTTSVSLASTAFVLNLAVPAGGSTLNGIAGGAVGRLVFVHNSGPGTVVLIGEAADAASSATRHFLTGSTLVGGYSALVWHTGSRWTIARPT
jgi:hypothetical protein